MELVSLVYRLTEHFPSEERFGLTAQIRRSAVSIPSKIAEGAARRTKREFAAFLHIAQGSLSELDTQLELSVMLAHLRPEEHQPAEAMMQRIDKMLSRLIQTLRGKS